MESPWNKNSLFTILEANKYKFLNFDSVKHLDLYV